MLSPIAATAGDATAQSTRADLKRDEDQIAAARADPRAFAPLYEAYVGRVYRYCYFRLGSREAAEDATAEVFIKAMTSLDRYRGGVFAAWLYTIARNTVADSRRRAGRGQSVDPKPAEVPGDNEERLVLLAAMRRLPEKQRTVIELQLAGWSGEEIGASLGISPAAVKMARYRGVARLRNALGHQSGTGGKR